METPDIISTAVCNFVRSTTSYMLGMRHMSSLLYSCVTKLVVIYSGLLLHFLFTSDRLPIHIPCSNCMLESKISEESKICN